uniref:Phlebovirus_G2 domain-containing protein n=1 Tax=Meloidogyne hapla TaxID=6305 RepID=A0A1I8B014_MELHA
MIASHLDSKLYCATQGEAESFSGCKLDASACQCTVTDPTVTCSCKDGRLEKLFSENPSKVLPIISQSFSLKNEKNRLYASLPHASIELQLSMENYQLIATHDRVKCDIKPKALIGCYSCIAGAKLELNCVPNFGNGALAHKNQQQFYYGPEPPPLEAEIVSSVAPNAEPKAKNDLENWWQSKSAKGEPSKNQKKEYGPAAEFKTRDEFLKDCKEKARKMPPLLRAVQTLQLAAVNSQKEAGNVDPETGKITHPTKTTEIIKNDSSEYEGRGFKLDHMGLSYNEIEKVEGLLKLGAEVTKQALMLHEQYKRNASLTRKAEVAIIKTRNALEISSSNNKQQKHHSYSNRYEPYNDHNNWKTKNDPKSWQCNTEKGYEGFGN